MSIDLSPETQERLAARAHQEGMSPDSFVMRIIDEREELMAIIESAAPPSQEDPRAKIERGFAQSERGETVDGDIFTSGLLREMDEAEYKRRV